MLTDVVATVNPAFLLILCYKQHSRDPKKWLLIIEVAYNRGEGFGSFHSNFGDFYFFFDELHGYWE